MDEPLKKRISSTKSTFFEDERGRLAFGLEKVKRVTNNRLLVTLYIVDYLRKNLPKDDARMHLFHKTKAEYLNKMIEEGYITREEIIEKIGREKIVEFFHIMSTTS